MASVIFLRGLNTYPDDDLRFGPINLGPAHQYLGPALTKSGFEFYPLKSIGRGSIQDQIKNAVAQSEDIFGKSHDTCFHIIGHSAGGIVARGLVHQLKKMNKLNCIKSVITITSPNYGSQKAQAIVDKKIMRPIWQRAFRLGGDNIEQNLDQFVHWMPSQIIAFNLEHPNLSEISYASIISGTRISKLPIALQLAHRQTDKDLIADGIVELESQPWGFVIDQLDLDHGAVLGLKTVLSPFEHAQNRKKFLEMVDKLVTYMKSVE